MPKRPRSHKRFQNKSDEPVLTAGFLYIKGLAAPYVMLSEALVKRSIPFKNAFNMGSRSIAWSMSYAPTE